MINRIYYKKGYKYQLIKPYSIQTDIIPPKDIVSSGGFIMLDRTGMLHIKHGYAWDGASCAIDSTTFMRGSLIHDALYGLMREGILYTSYRSQADDLLGSICRYDGMSKLRAWYVVWMVKLFAQPASDPKNCKPILYAP